MYTRSLTVCAACSLSNVPMIIPILAVTATVAGVLNRALQQSPQPRVLPSAASTEHWLCCSGVPQLQMLWQQPRFCSEVIPVVLSSLGRSAVSAHSSSQHPLQCHLQTAHHTRNGTSKTCSRRGRASKPQSPHTTAAQLLPQCTAHACQHTYHTTRCTM